MVEGYRHQNDPLLEDMGRQDMGACIHHLQRVQVPLPLCGVVNSDYEVHREVGGHMKSTVLCGVNGHDSPGVESNLGAWAVNNHHHVGVQVSSGYGRVILSGNGRHHLPLVDH